MPRAPVVPVFPAISPAVPAVPPPLPVDRASKPERPKTDQGGDQRCKATSPPPPTRVVAESFALGWAWHAVTIAILAVIIFAAYGNSFQSQWVLDNKYIIELDPRTKATAWNDGQNPDTGESKPGVRNIFMQDYWWPKGISGLYRPLTSFTYWLNWTAFGNGHHRTVREQVIGFHWVNLGIHWINAILVYFLLLRLVRRFWVAFFTAALFATHPIATESVTNIIGRADMIAATTVVGGLLLYMRAVETSGWRKFGVLMGLLLLSIIGVFSKESAFAVVFVAMAYDLIYRVANRIREFEWREFIIAIARVVFTIGPMIFFAITIYLVVLVPWMGEMNDASAIYQYAAGITPTNGNVAFDTLDPATAKTLYLNNATADGKKLVEQVKSWLPVKSKAVDGKIEIAKAVDPDHPITFSVHGTLDDSLPMSSLSLSGISGKLNLTPGDALNITFQDRRFPWLLTATIGGLLLIFTATALLTLRNFWWTLGAAGIGAVLLLSLASSYQPRPETTAPGAALWLCRFHLVHVPDMHGANSVVDKPSDTVDPNSVLMQLRRVSIVGLLLGTLIFLLAEAGFAFLWREPQEEKESSRPWRGFYDGYFVMLAMVVMLFTVRNWVFANSTPPEEPFLDNPLRGLGFFSARMTAVKVWGLLLWKSIWPVTLSCDYSFNQIPLFGYVGVSYWQNLQCILWLILLLGIVALAIWLGIRGQRAICFFIFLYLINYVPTSNWLLIIGSIMAERFMYLPLIGFVGIFVIGVDMVARRVVGRLDDVPVAVEEELASTKQLTGGEKSRLARYRYFATTSALLFVQALGWTYGMFFYIPGIGPRLRRRLSGGQSQPGDYRFVPHMLLAVLIILYGVRAFYRNWDWRTDVTLWESAEVTSKVSFRTYQSLAFALFEQDPPGNIDRMIKLDERGLQIVDPLEDKDNSSRLYLHLGMYYAFKASLYCKPDDKGQPVVTPEAREWLVKAVYILERAEPIDRAFDEINRERDLKRGATAGEEVDVGLDQIYNFLGTDYMTLGMLGQAEQTFRYMRQLSPTNADAYFKIAEIQVAEGHPDLAAVSCMQCIFIDKGRMDAWKMLNDIYQRLNTSSEPCMTSAPGGRTVLNMNHPLVRMNMVDAYREFIRIFRAANRQQLVQTATNTMLNEYKFPPELVNATLAEPIKSVEPAPPIYYKPGTKAQVPGGTMN